MIEYMSSLFICLLFEFTHYRSPYAPGGPNTVRSAAERHWREAGATSARAATSVYTPPYLSTVSQVGVRDCATVGARLRLARAYLAAGGATPGAPAAARGATRPTFDPGDVDHFSRPPPRRCSAACLLGSVARRLCIFFAYRWLPYDHGPCCTPFCVSVG